MCFSKAVCFAGVRHNSNVVEFDFYIILKHSILGLVLNLWVVFLPDRPIYRAWSCDGRFSLPLFYFLQPFNLISSSSFVLFLIIFQLYLISFFWGVFPLVSAFPEAILFYLQWNTTIFFLKICITAVCWNLQWLCQRHKDSMPMLLQWSPGWWCQWC